MSDVTVGDLEAAIRNVPDFPQPGIQFKDITPVLGDARLFAGAVDLMAARHADAGIDACVGIDARGFIFAAAAAKQLGTGFVPIRKQGKLPWKTHEESYSLEYGEATIAIHQDFVDPDPAVRKEHIQHTLKCIDLAHEMGIPCIRLNSGRWNTISSFDDLMAARGLEPILPGHTEQDGFGNF